MWQKRKQKSINIHKPHISGLILLQPFNTCEMSEKKHPSFGKIMLASAVGALIALAVTGLFKLFVFFGIVGSLNSPDSALVAKNSFLKIDLTKSIPERTPSELNQWMSESASIGFNDLLRCIEKASNDNRISGLYLYMGSEYALSWGKSEELRQALLEFAKSRKPILVYADNYTQQGYFLASAADSIYLNPSGMVEFRGIGAEALFFKDLLDRLAVKMTLVRPKSNDFKSAGETYTMDHMSDANRRQIREYITDIWDFAIHAISQSRNISTDRLNNMADNLSAMMANDALQQGLIDRLCFESDITATLKQRYGNTHFVTAGDYVTTIIPTKSKQYIAVIYAEGDVETGTGLKTAVYSDKITKAINEAADNKNIYAIVLRINSPGGQVTASEIMTHAVIEARKKKPVVVSMSDVAASAGYEISCNADCIVAEPTTITGSIGVFATIPEVGGTLKRYLGITTDTAMTNANATSLSILRPLSPAALELMQRNVEDFYKVFVQRVADGRGLKYDYVDSIARGRVWTGRDALELGLVDKLGGLNDAIHIAADMANLTQYRVVDYPADEGMLSELLNHKNGDAGTAQNQYSANGSRPAGKAIPASGDGVWIGGKMMIEMLNRICETRGLQARVEFFLLTE